MIHPNIAKDLNLLRAHRVLAWSVLAGVVLGVFAMCWHRPQPIPPKEQHTVDSLAATKLDFTARVDTLFLHETTFVRIGITAKAAADSTVQKAANLAARVDTLQRLAEAAADSTSAWKSVADTRGGL